MATSGKKKNTSSDAANQSPGNRTAVVTKNSKEEHLMHGPNLSVTEISFNNNNNNKEK
jgi:hypothetical protein